MYGIVITAGFILGVAVLAPAVIGLSFLSESLRRAPLSPLAHTLRWSAVLVALLPLLTAFLSAKKCAAPAGEHARAGLWPWMPFIVALVGAPLFAVLLHGVEAANANAQRRALRAAVIALRAAVKGGDQTRACELVSIDAMASAEDMAMCRRHVDGLKDQSIRLKELSWFVGDDGHFKTWGYWEYGRPPSPGGEDFSSAIPPEHQTWFLDAYFTAWMSGAEFLGEQRERNRFLDQARDIRIGRRWSPEARQFFATRLVPRISAAIKARKNTFGSPYTNDDLLAELEGRR